MTPERWQQIERIYYAAQEHAPQARAAYLAEACAGDGRLLREVESLLDRDPSSPDAFLNQPLYDRASTNISAGQRLGPYEIETRIGAGGMGEVWKARDTRLGRTVAIKVSKVGFDQRFTREARTVAALNHPHICILYDVGPNYFVMEYIDGKPLGESIPRRGMPLAEALDFSAQIASALAAAHTAGIVHRDLKPGNIMITADARVKVVDFGLARVSLRSPQTDANPIDAVTATAEGVIAGTVAYMSPEQAQGRPIDARSDIFSFGAVLYQMLTGTRAFQAESPISTLADIIHKDPRPAGELAAGLPRDLESILRRCLRKDPARRWQSMADLHAALLDLKDDPAPSPAPPNLPPQRRFHPAWLVALASVAVAAIALWLSAARQPAPEVWSGTLLGGSVIASHPRISPDGQWLAFRSIVDSQSQVAVMKPDAASWTVLTHDQDHGAVASVAWARDGGKIYFDREWGGGSIYSIAPLGGEPRLLLENAWGPEALPDGSLIAMRPSSEGRQQLLHFWPDSGRLQVLPAAVPSSDTRYFRVFPNGKEIAVLGTFGSEDGLPHLFALDLASLQMRELFAPQDFAAANYSVGGHWVRPETIAVSADGVSVYALVNHEDCMLLVAIPASGSRRSRVLLTLPQGATPLSIDPAADGSIYMDQSAFANTALKVTPAGTVLSQTPLPRDAVGLMPLSGGAFVYALKRGRRSQLLVESPGTEARPLLNTNEDVEFPAAWLGKGESGDSRIAFVIGSGNQSRLAIGSVDSGRILHRFGPSAEHVTALAAAPGGATLYYASDGLIWALPVSGGEPRKIGEGYDVIVDPTGETLYIMRPGPDGLHLFRMPAAGGAGEKIDPPPGFNVTPARLSPGAVNRDGRLLIPVNTRHVFFYQTAIFDPVRHSMNLVPAPPDTVVLNTGWTGDGAIDLAASRWTSTLWRYRPIAR